MLDAVRFYNHIHSSYIFGQTDPSKQYNPDQTPHSAASDQGTLCAIRSAVLDTLTSSKKDLFKFQDKYGRCSVSDI